MHDSKNGDEIEDLSEFNKFASQPLHENRSNNGSNCDLID
jgi:hypothetical protein